MKNRVIVIGASHNGISALTKLVRALPSNLPAAVFVVLHVSPNSPSILPELLSKAGQLPATHARDGERFESGRIYVAPPDRHMLLRDGTIRLSDGPRENWTRPAIDPLFRSAALVYRAAVVGVILTGQLDDGTAGLLAVKHFGGVAIVQDPEEATAPSMPLNALRYVAVDHECTITAIAALIVHLANDQWDDAVPPMDELLRLEDRIAEGRMTVEDWRHLEQLTTPAGLGCPDCGSALYEVDDPPMLRFRCRSGHAFSPETALAANEDRRQRIEASMFGALVDDATLARRLAGRAEYAKDPLSAVLRERAARLERQADSMTEWRRETRTAEKEEALALVR